jgi:hypothetical protein
LTRRANHRHIYIIAKIVKPAPGKSRRGLFHSDFESDGGAHSAAPHLPMHRRLSVASVLPSEPLWLANDLVRKQLYLWIKSAGMLPWTYAN